jgi:virulence-associated protein VapD
MPQMTDDQLTSIAQQFHDLAVVIAQFRLNRIHGGLPLNDPGIVQLLGLQWSLLNTSSSFAAQAAQVTLADADQAVSQIASATKAANAAIGTLKAIDQVMTIGSAAGVLAATILTGNMTQIASSVQGVYTAIQG